MKKTAAYPRGACPAARRIAMRMQQAVLETALASWPRRHSSLLEVNCGNGAFLEFLWHCGFEVHAAEANPDLRLKAYKRKVPGLEIAAAQDDDLPFDDDTFDWVIIHLENNEDEAIRACVNEAVRLAKRGFLVTFWNNASISAILWTLAHKKIWAENAASWWRVWHILTGLRMGSVTTVSTLFTPMWLWKYSWQPLAPASLPLGAWCAIRLDLDSPTPLTPLPLRLGKALRQPEPVLEPYNNEITCVHPPQPQKTDHHETCIHQ